MFIWYFFFKVLCFLFCVTIFPCVVAFCVWTVIYRIQGYKKIKGTYKYVGYGSFLKRVFIDFPRQKAYDRLTRNPDMFREYGFNLICGEQGKGKTITLVYMLLRFKKMYPKLRIKTNMAYKYEDGAIEDYTDLINSNNGIYGEIDVIDEVQNWFSSEQSRNFPPAMLQEITQQRKQRKMILGTSQVFTRVSKQIRENTYTIYVPVTFFCCLTVVRRFKPILNDAGELKDKQLKGIFFFVHNQEIREAFDTYKKIEKMSKAGFKSALERVV